MLKNSKCDTGKTPVPADAISKRGADSACNTTHKDMHGTPPQFEEAHGQSGGTRPDPLTPGPATAHLRADYRADGPVKWPGAQPVRGPRPAGPRADAPETPPPRPTRLRAASAHGRARAQLPGTAASDARRAPALWPCCGNHSRKQGRPRRRRSALPGAPSGGRARGAPTGPLEWRRT